ncbi:NAD(P)/FAD-dependent oxidoreductase [Phreatobacter cathodiphilus]|uniref:Assimilatory nitrite reductase large subunit n=1 Tax=Phreatobacter cathodiphilus TaxID=1868589 RepID=A0A2S0NF38_9HYPH|nr:FAD-dependent oxidoreductase [Phreatobacter cathodiphilus]AVO46780.1 assimilatory nitrite reductase large subunit [Phreatobacter cathodiphilus]
MSEPLVVIGNGMAAARLVEELGRVALGRYSILVVGAEPHLAYNRVLLSSVLAGEMAREETELKPLTWWERQGVTLVYGRRAVAVDRDNRQVVLEDGARLPYAQLVLATGSDPIRLPKPGMDLPGVVTFRDHADVDAMLAAAGPARRAVVIGGGLLGIEAASGLAASGTRVTLVHLMDRLMERQLDAEAAALLKAALAARGITVELGADTAAVEGDGHVTGLRLSDGRLLPADLVVCAVGIRPNATLAREAGLATGRGVLVDDRLATSDPAIHAIGECAEHRGICYGLVEPALQQAAALARNLSGRPATYEGTVLATNLKVSGIPVFSAGDFEGGPGAETVIWRDPALGTYRKLVLRGGALAGALLYGETGDGPWYLDLIRSGRPLGALRDGLIFGRALAEAA